MSQPQNHQLSGPISTYMACTPIVQLLYQALTDKIKASTTVNQAMDPIAQGAAKKAHLNQKQWFLF